MSMSYWELTGLEIKEEKVAELSPKEYKLCFEEMRVKGDR